MPAPILVFTTFSALGLLLAASGSSKAATKPKPVPVNPPVPTTSTPTLTTDNSVSQAAPAAAQAVMSEMLRETYANTLRALKVDDTGALTGTVDLDVIRAATQVAGRLEAAGFPEAAATLRSYAQQAAASIPTPPKSEQIPLPPQLSAEMQEKVQRMIQSERDPAKLRGLITALRTLPVSEDRDTAIETLSAMVVQIEAQNAQREALEAVDATMKLPTGVIEKTEAKPEVVEVVESAEEVLPPAVTPTPPVVTPTPKSAAQIAGEAMAKHLKSVQSKYGMPGAKGKEDKSIVKKFQSAAGLTADGLAGPGTLTKLASLGVGGLPLVMYWPRSSSLASVQVYRTALRRLATEAESQGAAAIANSLRISANYERGQAGVIQTGTLS